MSTSQPTVYLPTILLDETNYPSWFFRLESFLKGQKLYGFVDGTVPCPPKCILDSSGNSVPNPEFEVWCTQDQSIVNMIGQTLSSAATSCAVGSKTAFDLWRNLRNKFAASSRQNILQLKINLQSLRKGNDSIETYLDKVKVARDALETVGVFLDDEDVIVTVLRGLPSEYNAIKGVIRAQAVTSTLSDLKTLLKATEIDLETDSQSSVTLPLTAMVAQTTQLIHNSTSQTSPTVHTSPTVSSSSPSSFHSPQVPSQSSVSSSASAQSHYVPIPAMPYGFGPYSSSDSSFSMTGFYAGHDRGQSSNGNGGGSRPFNYGRNNAGGHGGGFARSGGFNGNGGGNAFTCQLCGCNTPNFHI